mmetsp:Transcript_33764/g.57034  ORF Transcript_33764/g.57034 Transcript_33764/m.57034 type:complete len:601 (-) Transcript_33764:132-1934(-)
MDGEHLDRVSSPSCMSQSHFHQASAEVTPFKEAILTGSSVDSEDVDGFGPPPAFPQNKSLGKRKLTLMSVSTSAGFRVGDDTNSEDESSCMDSSKHPQLVHRIKGGASSAQSSRENSPTSVKEEEQEELGERGQKRNYNDAMILASLSDVGSPKTNEDVYEEEDRKQQVKLEYETSPKSNHSTSSTAGTPLRSNVNSASDGVKPFALLPKPYANKRGKLVHEGKKEEPRDARPPPPPSFPGPYGGYPYPHPHGPPPPHHPSPYAGYPYPYHHPHHPPPPPGSMPPPPAYYGMHGHGPPTPMPPTPEYWGQYHSPEHVTETVEPARSGAPPFHPLSSPVKSSHVVPTDESDPKKSGHPHPGPPHGHAYTGPPPPGYPGYYPPPSIEYKRSFTVSVDESSPSRHHTTETSPGAPPPRPEMHPSSSSPPRPGPPPGHPESPYSGYPPPPPQHSGSDPYQPYDYASASPTIQYPQPHMGNYQFRKGGRTIHSEPIILKKKFSWRNYPELEEFLIANRPEYLRHSALNYTAEQKHFNNRLTEGLLEIAARHNYVFDESCFNFVAVRDRIRCYYKSYVQSSKKRGVVVGYSETKPHTANSAESGQG